MLCFLNQEIHQCCFFKTRASSVLVFVKQESHQWLSLKQDHHQCCFVSVPGAKGGTPIKGRPLREAWERISAGPPRCPWRHIRPSVSSTAWTETGTGTHERCLTPDHCRSLFGSAEPEEHAMNPWIYSLFEQVLFVYVLTAILPRLSDLRNLITVLTPSPKQPFSQLAINSAKQLFSSVPTGVWLCCMWQCMADSTQWGMGLQGHLCVSVFIAIKQVTKISL